MRQRFDQLGKQIGREALGLSGSTVAHDEILGDAQHADLRHEPDPARLAERARLGLLGRLAAILCLIEIYAHAPDEDEVLTCVGKLIAFRQQRMRARRRKRAREGRRPKRAEAFIKPFLWIIAAGRPTSVLTGLACHEDPDWPRGVYFAPGLLRVGIVVASELPRERETLLVRLMAAGPVLANAIEELGGLPPDAQERKVATQILLSLQLALGQKPRRTTDEQEFIMTMYKTWEDAQRGLRNEASAQALLTVLRVRGIKVTVKARSRVLAQKDAARLQRWLERAAVAQSLAEVFDEPS